MPYIIPERRPCIDSGMPPQTAGELNYRLFRRMLEYRRDHGESYATYNHIMGAHERVVFEVLTEIKSKKLDAEVLGFLEIDFWIICREYFLERNASDFETEQSVFRDVLGALRGSMSEFYRRYIAPYEDKAIAKNGDIIV